MAPFPPPDPACMPLDGCRNHWIVLTLDLGDWLQVPCDWRRHCPTQRGTSWGIVALAPLSRRSLESFVVVQLYHSIGQLMSLNPNDVDLDLNIPHRTPTVFS